MGPGLGIPRGLEKLHIPPKGGLNPGNWGNFKGEGEPPRGEKGLKAPKVGAGRGGGNKMGGPQGVFKGGGKTSRGWAPKQCVVWWKHTLSRKSAPGGTT